MNLEAILFYYKATKNKTIKLVNHNLNVFEKS